ncbi:phosphoglycolate phosphatase [Methylohalomonas lacus]|uniref:Phosphoglycolate phosphatase n=1 Tax=Methylohalomonas lacus TaxID=398773 RepID=A0AAE3L0S9_9GAMM|nr:phosphoglycolate phosphatase [Methylohalomonas lacus]MCS3902111.1 phosphoglycolate phosphatase [Methylohalomonas lacus]
MTLVFTAKRLIAFDLDGTLVDTVPDLAAAVDAMQAALDLPARGEARVRDWVGNGMERLVRRALTNDLTAEPDADLLARGWPVFLEAYAARPCVHSRFYPGAERSLNELRAAGYQLACITNKHSRFTDLLLDALGVYDHFSLVLSGDSLPRRKPDPLPLQHAGAQLQVTATQMLMVGDSITDVRAARAAGVDIVGVSYGYNNGRDIRAAAPDHVIDTLAELSALLPRAAA